MEDFALLMGVGVVCVWSVVASAVPSCISLWPNASHGSKRNKLLRSNVLYIVLGSGCYVARQVKSVDFRR